MNSNDNLNSKAKQSNLRLRHMFQSSDAGNSSVYIPETLDNEKLNKISLKFESQSKNEMTLIDSVRQMIDLSESNPTQSLLDYIDELKSLYRNERHQHDNNIDEEEIVKETVAEEVETVNIDEIISNSEKDLFRNRDQKSMLFDLINDINTSSTNQTKYCDEKFEKNISSMINGFDDEYEGILEDENQSNEIENIENNINEQQLVNQSTKLIQPKKRKGKFYAFLLFVIMGLTIIFYLYKDKIIELVSSYV